MDEAIHISLAAEELFSIGPFSVTNSLLVTWLVMVALIVIAWLAGRKVSAIPRGLQNVFEMVLEFLLNLIESVTQSRKKAELFLPFLATFFVFIFAANITDIIPGIGTIGLFEVSSHGSEFVPYFRPPAADLNFTLALAVISVLGTQLFGIGTLGLVKHLKKYFTIKGGPANTFVGLLEAVSEVAKMVSFSFRLFGNIFAGEVLLTVIAVIVPFVAPLPFYLLEAFVAFIQALVFTMLSLVFMTLATTSHDVEHAHN
ncbi:MAG: F0F1 ATP synthase subunit A [bacterium]|nr:F0F1 ATP synthase subunit A [bacterium]